MSTSLKPGAKLQVSAEALEQKGTMTAHTREFDLVLFGATGFTGALVAEELLARGGTVRWALAGRDRAKLEGVKARLTALSKTAGDLQILVADSHDAVALDALAKRTRVVCTTVGPYHQHGLELVRACAENGTHYCDITGETPFMRRTIDAHHRTAQSTGARIVHACGFDSIPSDLGCLILDEAMRLRSGAPCDEATLYVTKMRGGASGGTLASMLGLLDAAKREPELRKVLLDPYALNPDGERAGPDGPDAFGLSLEKEGFVGPFVMAGVNTRVVRRTNALLGYRYGRDFRYREVSRYRRSVMGALRCGGTSLGLGALLGAAAIPALRGVLARALPKPGEGPSKEQRERGQFRIALVGTNRVNGVPNRVTARVEGNRDPGYGFTAIMLSEAALCLACDTLTSEGGVLTPASAMGMTLVHRLRGAGMVLAAD